MAVHRVRSLLAPCILVRAVWEIDLRSLRQNGVRGLILDLDNTLVNWNDSHVSSAVRQWVDAAHREGMATCLVSNSAGGRRVRAVGKDLGMSVVTRAWKPLPIAFRRAMAVMGTDVSSTCAIGDQVFTDMLGANWLGMKTVLVAPLSARESPHTRLIRLIEAPLRRRWGRSGRNQGG